MHDSIYITFPTLFIDKVYVDEFMEQMDKVVGSSESGDLCFPYPDSNGYVTICGNELEEIDEKAWIKVGGIISKYMKGSSLSIFFQGPGTEDFSCLNITKKGVEFVDGQVIYGDAYHHFRECYEDEFSKELKDHLDVWWAARQL